MNKRFPKQNDTIPKIKYNQLDLNLSFCILAFISFLKIIAKTNKLITTKINHATTDEPKPKRNIPNKK